MVVVAVAVVVVAFAVVVVAVLEGGLWSRAARRARPLGPSRDVRGRGGRHWGHGRGG